MGSSKGVSWVSERTGPGAIAVVYGVELTIGWSTSRAAPGFVVRVDVGPADLHRIDPIHDLEKAKRAAESMARKVLDAEIERLTKARDRLGPEPAKEGGETP